MTHASYNRCPPRRYGAAHHTIFHLDKKFFVREHEIKKGKLMEQLALFYTITTTTCRARNRTVSITGRWSLWRRYTTMACAEVPLASAAHAALSFCGWPTTLARPGSASALAARMKFPERLCERVICALESHQFVTAGQCLSVLFDQLRFVIPDIQMAKSARAENNQHILCFCRKMRRSRSIGPFGRPLRAQGRLV